MACVACCLRCVSSPRSAFAFLLLGLASVVDLRVLCGWGETEGPENEAGSGWVMLPSAPGGLREAQVVLNTP